MITAKEFMKGLISFFLGVLGIYLVQFSGALAYSTLIPDEILCLRTVEHFCFVLLFLIPGIYLIKRYC